MEHCVVVEGWDHLKKHLCPGGLAMCVVVEGLKKHLCPGGLAMCVVTGGRDHLHHLSDYQKLQMVMALWSAIVIIHT